MYLLLFKICWIIFLTLAGIQIFYYLFFFSRLAFYNTRKKLTSKDTLPEISLIICAKDEERNLSQNLTMFLQQRYHDPNLKPRYEVIVVNDNSEDDTLFLLQKVNPGYEHFRYINLKQPAKGIAGKKYPLTVGIKGSAYDSLVLTDADCKPASVHWLQHISEGFSAGKDIVLGYGAYRKRPGLLNKVIRFETFFSALQYLSFALAGIPYMGVGRNLAYKKNLFFKHKGFLSHHHLPSGDDDLFINAAATGKNTTVVIHKDAITYSEPKQSWRSWFRQKTRHLSTGKYYKFKHQVLLGLFSVSQFFYYPLFILALFYRPFLYITLIVFVGRWILQAIVWGGALKKLNEKKLFWYCWPLEILMCLYYLIFTPALLFKPKKRWN